MAKSSLQKSSAGKSLKEITESVARQLAQGARPQNVIDQLIRRGWPESYARQFVANASPKSRALQEYTLERRSSSRRYQLVLLRSLLLIILGLAIIIIGIDAPNVYLGLFQFTAGVLLCIFESIDLLSGLADWVHHR
jgi:hypothetical protein